MLRKITIALAAASLLGAAAIPTDVLAFGRGGFGGGFHGGGFSRGFGGHGFVGHGFRCYAWTPYGYRWVCGYPYPYY
jgi:hypothetical protein